MGTDISTFAEVKNPETGRWEHVDVLCPDWKGQSTLKPFCWRGYRMFAFLADERNYFDVPPLIAEARGIPDDVSREVKVVYDHDSEMWMASFPSYVRLDELLAFDFDQEFVDTEEDQAVTFRAFLGNQFFAHIATLQTLGPPDAVRVIFWFD